MVVEKVDNLAFSVATTYNNTSISTSDLVEVDESGIAIRSGETPDPGETAQAGRVEYQLSGKKRDLYISKTLEQKLAAAARKSGVEVVMVTSGGQPEGQEVYELVLQDTIHWKPLT